MSNSSLATYKNISPNKTVGRNHAIDTITIHCMAGNLSIETCGNLFAKTSTKASSNYGISSDGRIGLYVDEKDRSWATSSSVNDNRAVTIEVASESKSPYKVTDKAYQSLIKLVADICKRNGIKKLVWSTNKADRVGHLNGCNMTVHRDYANKACPGDYLYNLHGQIAKEVNALLNKKKETTTTTNTFKSYKVQITATSLNIRKGAGTSYGKNGSVKKGEIYTIVNEKKNGSTTWGKLKSGAGWIALTGYTKKV